MNRLLVRYGIAALMLLASAWPSLGQTKQPGQPPQPSSIPGSSTDIGGMPNSRETGPLFLSGRVLMDTGQPVPEPVAVALNCGMRTVQAIRTDSKGYFQFTLGAGPQSNMDMDASEDTTFGGSLPSLSSSFGGTLIGCEVRVEISGYEPLAKPITTPADIEGINVGTLLLRRRAGVTGSSISVTSLQVPGKARKEFEQGQKDERSNHLASAEQHMEKAVGLYDKYAAAWTELGKIQATNRDLDKARASLVKATTADPQYIPPYMDLATLDLQTQQFDAAAETTAKVLAMDPTIGFASFIQAAADLKLDKLDEAEKSAKEAESEPHQGYPQVHVLLAQLFLQKQDYSNAATQLRAYLKESPKGPFAADAKKNLDEIEKEASAGHSGPSAEQPQTAP